MAQEEHTLGCSYSSGGGGGGSGGGGGGGGGGGCSGSVSSSRLKKVKQKKVPQRGLGVAQLEKIRLEEQQKKDSSQAANILAKNAIGSHTTPFLSVQCPKLGPGVSPFHNSVPLPPPSTTNLPSPTPLYRQPASVEIRHESSIQISKQLNGGGGEIGRGNWPRLWTGEYNLAGEKQRLDHHVFAFEPKVNLPSESNTPISPLPVVSQRSNQFQWPSSSSMVNSSSGISPSSVLSSQMEPPSNQSSHGKNYAPSRSEEDKIVGMKRSYPFSLESPPAPSLHCNLQPSSAASVSRPDELASCSNGYTPHMEPRNKCVREGPSKSSPGPVQNPSEVTTDNGRLNGDFLTLAPPSVASPRLNSKHKHIVDYSDQGHEISEYECISSQEYAKSQIHQPGPSGSVEQSFTFFPINFQIEQTAIHVSNSNGEKGETVDLSLKL